MEREGTATGPNAPLARSFPQALDEAHNLPAAVVIGLMEQRVGRLQEQAAALETGALPW